MPLYSWMLSSLLVCQIPDNRYVPVVSAPPGTAPAIIAPLSVGAPSTQASGLNDPNYPQTPAGTAKKLAAPLRPTTAQLVVDALALPSGGTISGQGVSLVSVLATVPTHQRRIEAVHAYWRLAEAVAEYHFCSERQQRIARLRAGNDEAADLRTAQAVAMAEIREAEVRVTTAQHDLAETLLLAPGISLPLPADQPLVGPYRTLFGELFAGKKAPERARMLDQTLPLRNRAVESHAAALLAAEDALDAAIELQAGGQGRLAGVIRATDDLLQQQRAFMAAVCRYNHDIADYALVAVSPQTSPELLAGTLIKQNRPPGQPVRPLPTTAVRPAAYQQPVVAPSVPIYRGAGVPPAMTNVPTRAAQPGGGVQQASDTASTGKALDTSPLNPPTVIHPANSVPGNDPDEPRLAPPQESAIPLVPEKPANGPTPRTSQKPINEPPTTTDKGTGGESGFHPSPSRTGAGGEGSFLPSTAARRAGDEGDFLPSPSGRGAGGEGLLGLTPAERAVKLTAALYRVPSVPSSTSGTRAGGTPAPRLIDCVRMVPADRRTSAIEAYWNARRIAVQYQCFVEQIQWLEALGPAVLAQNPPSPTALLVLRADRLAVEAELADAAADYRIAEIELSGLAGGFVSRGNVQIVRQPASIPFVGNYPLSASSPNRSWPLRRLEATLPRQQQAIIDQATVVVAADASRAVATSDFLAGRCSLDRALAAIDLQVRGTSTFLRDVTEYNRAIAQYATATIPPDTDPEKLVAALMVD